MSKPLSGTDDDACEVVLALLGNQTSMPCQEGFDCCNQGLTFLLAKWDAQVDHTAAVCPNSSIDEVHKQQLPAAQATHCCACIDSH